MSKFKFPHEQLSLTQVLKCTARHKAVLNDRETGLKAGKITASDWAEAQERIKKNVADYGSRI